jgi:hypothetical protein
MILNYLLSFGAYSLGALIYILDQIKKYQDVAETSPDPKITYQKKNFWQKEKVNVIQIGLYGIVSVIFLPYILGGSAIQLASSSGSVIWSLPMQTALIPAQIIIGWSGGRAVIAFMGNSKKELYKKVGITDADELKRA